jgi:hypothetical protein
MIRALVWGLAVLLPAPAVLAQDGQKNKEETFALKVEGKLSPDDPKDKERKGSPHQVRTLRMEAGRWYVIDLSSRQFDAFLRLEDATGKELAFDDDSGGSQNSQILFKAPRDDDYRLIITSFDGKSGAYTLTVKAIRGKLTGTQRLTWVRSLREQCEKAYQHKDPTADKRYAEALAQARKLAEEFPDLAPQAKELVFALEHLTVGRKAMEIEGEDLDGKQFKLSDYRGKVVVLDFWGNW